MWVKELGNGTLMELYVKVQKSTLEKIYVHKNFDNDQHLYICIRPNMHDDASQISTSIT